MQLCNFLYITYCFYVIFKNRLSLFRTFSKNLHKKIICNSIIFTH